MRRTQIYKQIAARKPELLDELLKPERLRLLGNPEMIRTLIRMDHSIQQCVSKRKGSDVCSQVNDKENSEKKGLDVCCQTHNIVKRRMNRKDWMFGIKHTT